MTQLKSHRINGESFIGANYVVVNEKDGKRLYVISLDGKSYELKLNNKQYSVIKQYTEAAYALSDAQKRTNRNVTEAPFAKYGLEETAESSIVREEEAPEYGRRNDGIGDIKFSITKPHDDNGDVCFCISCHDDEEPQEIKDMKAKLAELSCKLRECGVPQDVINSLVSTETRAVKLHITSDYRILLPDFDNREVDMKPLPRALYILLLRHPEGVYLKELSDYREELLDIYTKTSNRTTAVLSKSIDLLVNPLDNSANEKRTQANKSFRAVLSESIANLFSISGEKGELKRIDIPPQNIEWEEQ